jgi:serine/threonine protein kinase
VALTAEQMARLDRLLDQALDLDEEQRRSYLAQLPESDRDLLPMLQDALLQDRSGQLNRLPKLAVLQQEGHSFAAGQRVGPWELLRPLGKGGMAQVWLARRADGAYEREVALKLPVALHQRGDLAQRFARERDILAALEHPNIARFYDAGVSQEGLPYVALEYVRGKSIGAWCDARKLGIRQRVELFLQVLEAVHYAHDHAVLHRDIKPSNVLVNDSGEVRLLDFGVARMLEQSDTALTQVYGRVLTPEYASPEQILGEPLQERSDVYSLGVMLYELLVGSTAYRISARDSAGLMEKAANRAPIERPSTQVGAQAATARATTPKKLARHLRGDLDAIVLKCLAKAPADRYTSAAALAEDLQRYLAGEPVQARTSTPSYRFNKFVLRHRAAVAVSGLLVLLAGLLIYERIRAPEQTAAAPTPVALTDKSIAVLPFVDMSEHHDQEYFSDGLSEELIERLSRSPDLKVIARTSSFYFKGKQATIGEIARALQVSNVLEGSVRKSRRTMRVTVQLIRASDGSHLWSQTYDKTPDDIFKVQDEIAVTVARALQAALAGQINQAQARESNTEAYNLFLQGEYFRKRFNKTDSFRASEFYQKAIQLAPHFAQAWSGLAGIYALQAENGWIPRAQGIGKARDAIMRAIGSDPNLAAARRGLGRFHEEFDWDWAAARAQFERARELDPGDLDNAAHIAWVSEFLFGRFDNYIWLERQLVARDPLDSASLYNVGFGLFHAGRYEQAADALRHVLVMNPSFAGAQALLGVDLLYLGHNEEALAAAKSESDEKPRLFALSMVDWAMGRRAESDATLKEYEKKYADVEPESIAVLHAYRGEADAAFEWLERAYRLHDGGMELIRADPTLRSLRADRRFRAMLVRMKLDGDGP